MTSGYSARPLGRKLGLKAGMRCWFDAMPEDVRAEILCEAPDMVLLDGPEAPMDLAHIFVTECAMLACKLRLLLPLIARDGTIWVSWPKKSAKAVTDISEDLIRTIALPLQLVDVKVCAVDEIWSGLKLVIRREHR